MGSDLNQISKGISRPASKLPYCVRHPFLGPKNRAFARARFLTAARRVVPAQRRPGRSNRPKIDSIIYSLGFGNRESRVDFFALSIPILGYKLCIRPIRRAFWGDRKSRHRNMSYRLRAQSLLDPVACGLTGFWPKTKNEHG